MGALLWLAVLFCVVAAKDCSFSCPSGKKAVANPKHTPSHNGCGSGGFKVDVSAFMDLETKCCNSHDLCYDTCGNKFDDCEEAFAKCLKSVCKENAECSQIAAMLELGTQMFGCGPFKASQSKACVCVDEKEL